MIVDGDRDSIFNIYVEYSENYGEEILYISTDVDVLELEPVAELTYKPGASAGGSIDSSSSSNVQDSYGNIEEIMDGKTWISTGNEYEGQSSTNERMYDFDYGDVAYTVENGVISHPNLSSEYLIDQRGTLCMLSTEMRTGRW